MVSVNSSTRAVGSDSAISRYRADVAALAAHQKSSRGAPPYSLLINRPLGRRIAALAHLAKMTPNQVSIVSSAFTMSALALFAVVTPSWPQAIAVTVLLVLGYAIDSADGQLARLTTGGTLAGEWLDHTLDMIKLGSFHAAVLISAYRFDPGHGVWHMGVAIAFGVIATTLFFILILTDQLRRTSGVSAPPRPKSWWFMLLALPTDYGIQCLWMVMRPSSELFFVGYALLAVANLGYLIIGAVSRFRQLMAADRAGASA